MPRTPRTVEARDETAIATGATLPSRGPAPDPAPVYRSTLLSGDVVEWRFPDPFKIIAFNGLIPDPTTAATIELLIREKEFASESDPRKFIQDAQKVRGMYGLVSHMLVKPRLDVTKEFGDGKEVLGRAQIGYRDVVQLYTAFLFGPNPAFVAITDADDAGGTADVAPDGDTVSQDAG